MVIIFTQAIDFPSCFVDDDSSNSAVLNPEKDAKRSYVPRRLVIGNDEYDSLSYSSK